jgi:ribose 5-phosphate isomerase A
MSQLSSDDLKRVAAQQAVDHVESGMVLGLGSGSTMRYVLIELGQRLADGRLHSLVGVPSSDQTEGLAREAGIPLGDFAEYNALDLAIDGADEIDPQLNLIKGLGGFLVREKIVVSAAQRFIVVADSSKLVPQLGTRSLVPIEVIPLAAPLIARRLAAIGGNGQLRTTANGELYITDNGNQILDWRFGLIEDPEALNITLLRMPGVVDHGLFLGMASMAIVAGNDGVRVLSR